MGEESHHDPASSKVIGLAIEVHRHLGPGLLESAYEDCLAFEFREHAIAFRRQAASSASAESACWSTSMFHSFATASNAWCS